MTFWMLILPFTAWFCFIAGKWFAESRTERTIERVMFNMHDELERAHEQGVQSAVKDRFGDFEAKLREREQIGWDKGYDAGYEEALEDQ